MRIFIILLLFPTLVWAGTWRDDFEDGNLDGWQWVNTADLVPQLLPGKIRVENGEVIMEAVRGATGLYIGDVSWSDYEVEVDVKVTKLQPLDGEGVYIVARTRWPAAQGDYIFSLGTCAAGQCVRAFNPLNLQGAQSKPWNWKLGQWYRLKLVAQGDHFSFYVDGKLAIEYVDATYKTGKTGFGVQWQATVAHFDNFVLSGPGIPGGYLWVKPEGRLATLWGQLKRF
jgi:hypothetical protein